MASLFAPPQTPVLLPIPAAVAAAGEQAAMWEEVRRIVKGGGLRSFGYPIPPSGSVMTDTFAITDASTHPCCWRCTPGYQFMLICQVCGNKRCPHASDHRLDCTRSNEPGQPGSVYSHKRQDA